MKVRFLAASWMLVSNGASDLQRPFSRFLGTCRASPLPSSAKAHSESEPGTPAGCRTSLGSRLSGFGLEPAPLLPGRSSAPGTVTRALPGSRDVRETIVTICFHSCYVPFVMEDRNCATHDRRSGLPAMQRSSDHFKFNFNFYRSNICT